MLASINVTARKVDFIFLPLFATAEPYRLRFKPQAAARTFDVLHGLYTEHPMEEYLPARVRSASYGGQAAPPYALLFAVRRRLIGQ